MNYKYSLFSGLSLGLSSLILIMISRVYPVLFNSIILTLIIPGLIYGTLFTLFNFGLNSDSIKKTIINSIGFIISTVISGVFIILLLAGIEEFTNISSKDSVYVYLVTGLICALLFDFFISLLNFTPKNLFVDFGIIVTITLVTTIIGFFEKNIDNQWEWIHFINSVLFGFFIGIKLASKNKLENTK